MKTFKSRMAYDLKEMIKLKENKEYETEISHQNQIKKSMLFIIIAYFSYKCNH